MRNGSFGAEIDRRIAETEEYLAGLRAIRAREGGNGNGAKPRSGGGVAPAKLDAIVKAVGALGEASSKAVRSKLRGKGVSRFTVARGLTEAVRAGLLSKAGKGRASTYAVVR